MKNKQKTFLLMATMLACTPAFVATSEQAEASVKSPFKDVSSANPYYEIIHEMRDKGIINGYEDNTFRPNVTLSRQHAAVLVHRAVGENLQKKYAQVNYSDLSTKHAYFNEIQALAQAGLLNAKNGNIEPGKMLSRGEMAKILVTAFDLTNSTSSTPKEFKDVKPSDPNYAYIQTLYTIGITTGFEDNTFRPNDSLTRSHYALFMYRAMNFVETGDVNGNGSNNGNGGNGSSNNGKPNEGSENNAGTGNNSSNNGNSDKSVEEIAKEGDGKVMPKDEIAKHKPNNYDPDKLERQQISVRVEQGHNFVSKFLYGDHVQFHHAVQREANQFGMTGKEFVNIVNHTIKTNSLFIGDSYALYYNHNTGWVHLTLRNE